MFGTTKHTAYGSLEPYTPQEPMRKLIAENNLLLMALSRFEIALGFGTKTVAQVCADNGVDTSTFLAVANFLSDRPYERFEISLPSLVKYLKMHTRIFGLHPSGNTAQTYSIHRLLESGQRGFFNPAFL